ncbi:unnamed protein product, partial [Discosporangium mesarthrocarpum]
MWQEEEEKGTGQSCGQRKGTLEGGGAKGTKGAKPNSMVDGPTMMITGQKYIWGSKTMLGPVASPKEVFMLDQVIDLRVDGYTSKASVTTRPPPVDWASKGNEDIENYLSEVGMLFQDPEAAGVTEFYAQKL